MLFNIVALALLGFGFVVLVVTFLWIARLLSMRSHGRAARELKQALRDRASDEADPPEDPVPEAAEADEAAMDAEERRAAGRAVILGANLSLILGILACLLFWFSPLFSVLSMAGIYYATRCVWTAWRRFRVFVLRALIGLVLSLLSLGLHYLKISGQITTLLPFLPPP